MNNMDVNVNKVGNPNMNNKKTKSKKGTNILLIFLVVVVLIIGYLILNPGGVAIPGLAPNSEVADKIDTGTSWGNQYAKYLMENYKDYNNYDIAFINLDFTDVPELLIKYKDSAGKENLRVIYSVNKEILSTKNLQNATVHLIYSLETKEVDWYVRIGISTNKEFGSYTKLAKMINGTAYNSDIKASTTSEKDKYLKNYRDGNYKIVFYNLKNASFEEDITTVVSRYSEYNKKINNLVDNLKEEFKDEVFEEEKEIIQGDLNTHLTLANYKAKYGLYSYTDSNNVVTKIILNKNKSVYVMKDLYSFEVVGNTLKLENDQTIIVNSDGTLNYNGKIFNFVAVKFTLND